VSNELRKSTGLVQGIACTVGLDRGDDAGLTRLSEELSAAVNVKELDAFEMVLCRQEIPFWDVLLVAAGGAGFRSVIELINENQDQLVCVDACVGSSTGAIATVVFSRTTTVLTTDNGLVAARDGRTTRGTVPGVRIRSQNGVALPAGVSNGASWEEDTGVSVPVHLPVKVLLPPGQALAIFPGTDNQPIRASFAGRVWQVANRRELSP
jgi:hypothetical protein